MLFYASLILLVAAAIQSSEQARSRVFQLNGKILAVGMDNNLWMRGGVGKKFTWIKVAGSCCVTQIHVMNNGFIVGVGTNRKLYLKKSVTAPWELVPNSCCVKDLTTVRNKTCEEPMFVGVGMNGKLYSKKTLNSPWVGPYANSGTVKAVAGVTGQLYGIGMDNFIYRRPGLNGRWQKIPGSCCVKDIYVRDDVFTHLTYSVGLNNKIYTSRLKGVAKVKWGFGGHHTCCIKSIQVQDRRLTAKIIGVGMSNNLHFKLSLNSQWFAVSKSGSVTNILALKNGNLVGVGVDHKLYIKSSVGSSSWRQVPNSCCVKSVAQLLDGRIVGVGMKNRLWKKTGLNGRWILIPNSGSVTKITVDKSDRIIGIGTNRQLYVKRCYDNGWKGPLKNSGALVDVSCGSDGYLYGVGTNNRIYKKVSKSIASKWKMLPKNNCCVKSIAVN